MTLQEQPIQTRRLSKSLGGRMVLREVDFEIAVGECVALTGGNGSGKTTLLRCLAAITRPTTGTVSWFGRPAADRPEQRRLVGMVSHDSHLYAHLTLRENLIFAARMCAVKTPLQRANTLLKQLGLSVEADQRVHQVSRGMRQRLALARALIHAPRILLLDEPFSGLDSTGREWLTGILLEQRTGGTAVCFATHEKEPVRQLADRMMILRNGTLSKSHTVAVEPVETNPLYAA